MDLMIDFETMDVIDTAAITAIGAVFFNPLSNTLSEEFYCTIDLVTAVDAGRTMSASTVEWWMKQSDEARRAMITNTIPHRMAMNKFSQWLTNQPFRPLHVWAKGPTFDIQIAKSAFAGCNLMWPFKFWEERCVRTIEDLAWPNGDKPSIIDGVHHNAIDDAKFQAQTVQEGFRILHMGHARSDKET